MNSILIQKKLLGIPDYYTVTVETVLGTKDYKLVDHRYIESIQAMELFTTDEKVILVFPNNLTTITFDENWIKTAKLKQKEREKNDNRAKDGTSTV